MSNSFDLHVRLTKIGGGLHRSPPAPESGFSEADCDVGPTSKKIERMTPEFYLKSLDFIKKIIIKESLGGPAKHLSINYIGIGLLDVPEPELREMIFSARLKMKPLFKDIKDGAQIHLIESEKHLENLAHLFGSRLSFLADPFLDFPLEPESTEKQDADSRRGLMPPDINGSPVFPPVFSKTTESIPVMPLSSEGALLEYQARPGHAILIVNAGSLSRIPQEVVRAEQEQCHLTLRPHFTGDGSQSGAVPVEHLSILYKQLFEEWFMRRTIRIQPFFQLTAQMWGNHQQTQQSSARQPNFSVITEFQAEKWIKFNQGCPFQANCAVQSLAIEPNGDLYLCMDTADSKQQRLGNALTGEWDRPLWLKIKGRTKNLQPECQQCSYQHTCQGGCLKQSLDVDRGIYGRTELCEVWKTVFRAIEHGFQNYPPMDIENWLTTLGEQS